MRSLYKNLSNVLEQPPYIGIFIMRDNSMCYMDAVQHEIENDYGCKSEPRNPEHKRVPLSALTQSEFHFRDTTTPPKTLQRSIERLGIITPLVCVETTDTIAVLDGMKRLNAAKELNNETVPVIVYNTLSPQKQIEVSVVLNTIPNNSDVDSEKEVIESIIDSYDHLTMNDYHNVSYAIGFESDFERLMFEFNEVDYISAEDIDALIDYVPHIADISYFSFEQYKRVDGIGDKKAKRMATVNVSIKREEDVFDPDAYTKHTQQGIDDFV